MRRILLLICSFFLSSIALAQGTTPPTCTPPATASPITFPTTAVTSSLITQDIQGLGGQPGSKGIDPTDQTLLTTVSQNVLTFQLFGINYHLYNVAFPGTTPLTDFLAPMVNQHLTNFADAGAGGSSSSSSDPMLQGGDVNIANIFNSLGFTQKDTRYTAALQFLTNLIDFNPSGAITITNLCDPSFVQKFAQALANQAKLSVARQAIAESISKRVIPPQTQGSSNPPSWMQKMQTDSAKRYLSANGKDGWVDQMQGYQKTITNMSNPQSQDVTAYVVAEIAQEIAYLNYIEFERYKQGERIEALLAAMLVQSMQQSQAAASALGRANGSQ